MLFFIHYFTFPKYSLFESSTIGEGYTNIIEEIITVHIELDLVTVIGYVRT